MWIALALCVLLAGYSLYASAGVARSGDYTTRQKGLQLLLVWLVPLFGALLVHMMLGEIMPRRRRADRAFTPDEVGCNPGGIGPADGPV